MESNTIPILMSLTSVPIRFLWMNDVGEMLMVPNMVDIIIIIGERNKNVLFLELGIHKCM